MIRGVFSSEKLFIGGDLNGNVGTVRWGFERVHGGFGYGEQNQEGEDIYKRLSMRRKNVINTRSCIGN
jgi:hypothetical protein